MAKEPTLKPKVLHSPMLEGIKRIRSTVRVKLIGLMATTTTGCGVMAKNMEKVSTVK
jgi:hypothetical protein